MPTAVITESSENNGAEPRRHFGGAVSFFAFQLFVDFDGRLVDQEEAAADQDQVAAGDLAADH
jgi:hypothetical protein